MTFVVFDLDGTLIDGYDAIADALAYAMKKFGLEELPPEQVRAMVGHGLEKLLEKAVGRETAPEGVRLFRERYPHVAVPKTRLLPDVPAVLASLEQRGYSMAVASNKPARFSRMILDACGVEAYFAAVAGPAGTVVVGDMEVDSEFARAAGCRVVLVPSGSRTREELREVDADALLDSLSELPEWLDSQSQ